MADDAYSGLVEPPGGLDSRFCEVMNGAPVMIWVSGEDKLCNWFNKPWLEFTGRTMTQEVGYGWADGVHPEDYARCLQIYVSHFDTRQEFRMQYRLRHRDGEYRWIDDTGVPRYARDGKFLGYIGSCIDIHAQRAAEEELRRLKDGLEQSHRYLTEELDHRVKNVLARVSAIAAQTGERSNSTEEFVETFDRRIQSMAAAHTLLSQNRWRGVGIADLIGAQVAPYANGANAALDGPNAMLTASVAQALGTVIHELVTNAVKYGALSRPGGRVTVNWTEAAGREDAAEVRVEWREIGGPPVLGELHSGYGTDLIRNLIPHEIGGMVDLTFALDGVCCRMSFRPR